MKKPKGFAVMDPARVREIASLGGKASQASGRAHKWTSTEARIAGRIGGRAGKHTAQLRKAGIAR